MKPKGLYILGSQPYQWIYGAPERERITELVDIIAPAQTAESIRQDLGLLHDTDLIFSGWGCPLLDKELLDAAPNLKIVFYGAGSIRAFTTEEFWARGITICSAWGANAVPVSEYTLAAILFGLKSVWQNAAAVRQERRFQRQPSAGAYGSTVGLVSLGMIGRLMVEHLKRFEVKVIAYDPYVTPEQGAALGVEMVPAGRGLPPQRCRVRAHPLAARDGRHDHRQPHRDDEAVRHLHQHLPRRGDPRE